MSQRIGVSSAKAPKPSAPYSQVIFTRGEKKVKVGREERYRWKYTWGGRKRDKKERPKE